MKYSIATLVAFSFLAEQVTATDLWGSVTEKFDSVTNTDNRCKPQQEQGFTWDELDGDFDSYGDLSFTGFKSEASLGVPGKLRKRTFQEKCITGSVSKDAEGPKIFSDADVFSIKEFDVSVDVDTNVEFLYGMEDGSTCKQTARCSAGGSVVRNSQCGGAKSVTFKVAKQETHESCKLGIHKIDFDCNPPEPAATPDQTSTTTAEGIPTAAGGAPEESIHSSHVFPVGSVGSPFQNTSVSTAEQAITTATEESSIIQSSSNETPVDQSSATTDALVTDTVPIQGDIVTEVVRTTVSTCQPGETITADGSTTVLATTSLSTITVTETSTICTKCAPGPTDVVSSAAEQTVPVVTESSSVADQTAPAPTEGASSAEEVVPTASESSITDQTAAVTTPGSSPATENLPGDIVTEVVRTTVTTCQPGETVTSDGSTIVLSTTSISTITLTEASTVCTKCAPQTTTVLNSTPTSDSTPTDVPSESTTAVEGVPVDSVTEIVRTTITTCLPGETITSDGSTTVLSTTSISTVTLTETSTICTKCITTSAAGPESTPAPVPSDSTSAVEIVPVDSVTEVVRTTVSTCQPGETITSEGSTTVLSTTSIATLILTETSTVCTKCVTESIAVPESTPASVPSESTTAVDGVPVDIVTDSTPVPETNPAPVPSESTTAVDGVPVDIVTDSTPVPETTPAPVPSESTTAAEGVPVDSVTEVLITTVSTCQPGETITSEGSTTVLSTTSIATLTITETSTVCTKCVPPAETAPAAESTSSVENVPVDSVTEVVVTTLTTCQPGETITEEGTTTVLETTSIGTVTLTETSTICTKCAPASTPVPSPSESTEVAPTIISSATEESPVLTTLSTVVTGPSESAGSELLTSSAESPPDSTVTEVVRTTVTTCQPGETVTFDDVETVLTAPITSTLTVTETSTICDECTATPTEIPANPANECPDVLPKCLNTWMYQTGCKDNTDSECYCKQAEFTTNVMDCVASRGADDTEIQEAISYMAGICAAFIQENPAIITACPSDFSLATPEPTATATDEAAPAVPYTTITVEQTMTVPCTFSAGDSQGLTIPSTSTVTVIKTTVAVPQVQFKTATETAPGATLTQAVELAPATSALAQSTLAAPGQTTPYPVLNPTATLGTVVATRATASVVPFEGAASHLSSGWVGIILSGILAFLML